MLVEVGLKDNTKGVYPSNIYVRIDDTLIKPVIYMPNFSTIEVMDNNFLIDPYESEKITVSNIDLESTDLYNGILTGYIKVMIQDVLLELIDLYRTANYIAIDPIKFFEDIDIKLIAALYAYVICKNRGYCDMDSINKLESNYKIIAIYNTLLSGESYSYQR